ncbi:hypothetical protein B7494_g8434 [Chlorociboria aeruginascens]|nr:hypothetical protein B7494_g8434 [Chlorociboria aeruginascens]
MFRTPQKLVTVFIGEEKEEFTIHKSLIGYHSPFLETAFQNGFVEGAIQTMAIENTEVKKNDAEESKGVIRTES